MSIIFLFQFLGLMMVVVFCFGCSYMAGFKDGEQSERQKQRDKKG